MNILVTGVSRGLGLAIAENLLESGGNVYGISRKRSEQINQLADKYPQAFHYKEIDLKDPDSLHQNLFKDWLNNSIPIHGFVNNAALAYDDIITNLRLENLDKMYRVNVFSPFLIVKYCLRNMIFNRIKGSIVHISSISVHTGYKGLAMYASTKGALEAFSKNTAREWGEKGIRSNCLVAGFMETDMSGQLDAQQKNRIYNRTSLKKPTTLASVANMVNHLISEEAESVTGQNIHVDSGTI